MNISPLDRDIHRGHARPDFGSPATERSLARRISSAGSHSARQAPEVYTLHTYAPEQEISDLEGSSEDETQFIERARCCSESSSAAVVAFRC